MLRVLFNAITGYKKEKAKILEYFREAWVLNKNIDIYFQNGKVVPCCIFKIEIENEKIVLESIYPYQNQSFLKQFSNFQIEGCLSVTEFEKKDKNIGGRNVILLKFKTQVLNIKNGFIEIAIPKKIKIEETDRRREPRFKVNYKDIDMIIFYEPYNSIISIEKFSDLPPFVYLTGKPILETSLSPVKIVNISPGGMGILFSRFLRNSKLIPPSIPSYMLLFFQIKDKELFLWTEIRHIMEKTSREVLMGMRFCKFAYVSNFSKIKWTDSVSEVYKLFPFIKTSVL